MGKKGRVVNGVNREGKRAVDDGELRVVEANMVYIEVKQGEKD